jgi:hypothetical protein
MCTCDGGVGPGATNDNCNVFNFMSGYLLYSDMSTTNLHVHNPLLDLIASVPLGEISAMAYEAMFIATSDYDANTTSREQAYQFCNLSYASCTIVTINSFDNVCFESKMLDVLFCVGYDE